MNEVEFQSPVGPPKDLRFRRMRLVEELGRLPEYHLDLLRDPEKVLKPEDLLGKQAAVMIRLDNEKQRYVHSYVTRFERGGTDGNDDVYQVVMRPWLWLLTLGTDCRIFQDKSVVDILDEIFAEYKATSYVEKNLSGTYAKRPYTVQYRETDFEFVSRLMEEEGLYYFFKHESNRHTLALCDSLKGHPAAPAKELEWNALQGKKVPREDIIKRWNRVHTLQSAKVTLSDFAAEAPTKPIVGSAVREGKYGVSGKLEVFDYPGGHDDLVMGTNTGEKSKRAEALAKLRINRLESQHVEATGLTPYRALTCGQTFNFSNHEDKGKYLVTGAVVNLEFAGYEANHDAKSSGYLCRFNCVPVGQTPFLPRAVTPRPSVNGPQTATVVGPKDNELHVDKYGRVKLQFHWDRVGKSDEKSSCWVRVSHPWAGKGFGMVALPRVGDEVVVEFLDGNPDRPLITGRVYNGTNNHPYELPGQATVSGIRTKSSAKGGAEDFNELRFDDKKGSEYVWMQAQKDYHQLVKNDHKLTIKNESWTSITKNHHEFVGGELDLKVGGTTKLDLAKDVTAQLGGDLLVTQTGALGMDITGKVDIKTPQPVALSTDNKLNLTGTAGVAITATAQVDMKGLNVVLEGSVQISLKAGSSFITVGPAGVFISGPIVMINSGGSGMSAQAATKASPAKAKAVDKHPEHNDPLAPKK